MPHQAGLTLAFSARPRTWPSPDSTSAKALLEHLDLAPVAINRVRRASGPERPDPRVDFRRPEEPRAVKVSIRGISPSSSVTVFLPLIMLRSLEKRPALSRIKV